MFQMGVLVSQQGTYAKNIRIRYGSPNIQELFRW